VRVRHIPAVSLMLEIPDDVARALKLPPDEAARRLRTELAVTLDAQNVLSLHQAGELAGMDRIRFGMLLGERGVPRHYTAEDLQQDARYGRGE
jgi:predicted HTH domain antitoxin